MTMVPSERQNAESVQSELTYWREKAERLERELSTLTAASPVPTGGKLVPVEPTQAMLEAARDWSVEKFGRGIGNDSATGCYAAMLAASPQPPVVEGWRDIASAPKDGMQVLLWQPHWEAMQTAVWCNDGHNGPGWLTMDGGEVIKPSHWQPLPAPPAAPEAGR